MSIDCCVALPRGAMGVSEVCDCGIPYLSVFQCSVSWCHVAVWDCGIYSSLLLVLTRKSFF